MTESESTTPLKHQLAVLGLIVVLGLVAYVLTRGNPYETPSSPSARAWTRSRAATPTRPGTASTAPDRTKCGFIARRSGRVGAGDDPLQALFDQGVERYPDLGEAVLESVTPTHDPDRVEVRISWGRWQVELPMVRQDDAWRFDKVSEVALGGVRPRPRAAAPAPAGE